ncbi:MAG: Gfo/Idh/MocA family oxidoreductase [Spirochaetia bacterium]|nr:Gfo/Idh/MocA family oxidoreductase [Spirochaetia bacterium]
MNQVRWGMIGIGDVAERKSGPGLYKAKGSMLRGIYGRNAEKAQDFARRHGVDVVYDSVDDLLSDPMIDAVYMPVPPEFHKEYAIHCLEAGKIPYMEKPMAMNHAECMAVVDKAKEKGLPAYVAYYRRGQERFIKLKEILASGVIGELRFVELRQIQPPDPADLDVRHLPWRLDPAISGGGKFLDMAVHVLDALDFLIGRITEVKGLATNLAGLYQVEDTVSASFRFDNGVVGSGLWCYVGDHSEESVHIVGEKGSISFEGMAYGPVTVQSGSELTVHQFTAPEHLGMPYIQTIVDELRGLGKSPADLQAAVNTTWVADQILADYRASHPIESH